MNLNKIKEIIKKGLKNFMKIVVNLFCNKLSHYMLYVISISVVIKITMDINLYISILKY
ncbi:hypothetical protein IR152_00145 [Clostridioides sp. ES-S-0108-01]|uniref:hypothetical protein n=1 Tax=unclassified Clostridioides TaxID=2635829 RepID=UPI001D0C19C0|nr:hypothetical protein [Clostridioides sp. ES-S-0171-01]MCC0687661.1 hypothetical protein [Clostridioides sp. ES-S-0056-01]MCC0714830.1 hypothetical protein [Clostridioides sp. ES-S-0077-01]MCC0781567.1 hypothetical protein [Clostridioides sp. ES-S-0108-01]UDN50127.1 hypothetical protein JJC16_12195 [Clostridioides sp. ES-S-0107-01]UDN53604.1 hypothetical protein JJC02_11885 [Clostridioides sp. ES-S-0054-01]